MVTIRLKTLLLCGCFAVASWLLVAQTLNNTVLLLMCLVCFLALTVWAAIKNMAMPIVLFFLPFAPLLKLRPGTISFFTIALLLVYAVYTVTGSRRVKVLYLVPALLLMALTLVVKTAYGYDMDNTYILFAITLMLIPFLSRELNEEYDFYWLTLCFALGICLAAVTAQFLMAFPTISRYIGINTSLGIIRRSGYFGDPNFYSAHITAALSGMLVLLLKKDKNNKTIFRLLMVAFLFYCGLLSVSKSFLLISICLFLLWVIGWLSQKEKLSVKLMMVVTLVVIGGFLLSSTVFNDLLNVMFSRFGNDANWSEFTTGRTDLWRNYVEAIASDPLYLLFGRGFTDVIVGEKISHNTIIQVVYQFGLVGSALLLWWIINVAQILLNGARLQREQISQLAILLLGCFGPWMALDYLFFDEFFLLPIYVCMAVRFLHQQQQEESPLIEEKSVVL